MGNEYKSYYKKDLMDMIDSAALEVIRLGDESDADQSCPLRARIQGVLDLVDEIKARLNDPEVD